MRLKVATILAVFATAFASSAWADLPPDLAAKVEGVKKKLVEWAAKSGGKSAQAEEAKAVANTANIVATLSLIVSFLMYSNESTSKSKARPATCN